MNGLYGIVHRIDLKEQRVIVRTEDKEYDIKLSDVCKVN